MKCHSRVSARGRRIRGESKDKKGMDGSGAGIVEYGLGQDLWRWRGES